VRIYEFLYIWIFVCSAARADRPPEAIDAERVAAEAEVRDLERRAHSLDEQAAERRDRLRRRLRALYKLSSGGMLRLLAGSDSTASLVARESAVRRVVARDLDELRAVSEESRAAGEDLARAHTLAVPTTQSPSQAPTGLAERKGRLLRPVQGAVVSGFGVYKDGEVMLARRGVEMRAGAGETVRAIAGGEVKWVGEVAGFGTGVAVDHGDGWITLSARLRASRVTVGEPVGDGQPIGEAAGPTVYFELSQGGTPLNPFGWLLLPTK
jgi:septal ring factor EnvC (AmiA/AmiB activator)